MYILCGVFLADGLLALRTGAEASAGVSQVAFAAIGCKFSTYPVSKLDAQLAVATLDPDNWWRGKGSTTTQNRTKMEGTAFWRARSKGDMRLLKLSFLIPGMIEESGKKGPRARARSIVEANGDVLLTITSANLDKVLNPASVDLVLNKVTYPKRE